MIGDSARDAEQVLHHLTRAGIDIDFRRVDGMQSFGQALIERPWDIVLCVDRPPDLDALNVLAMVDGNAMIDAAKITGITPAMLTRSGR